MNEAAIVVGFLVFCLLWRFITGVRCIQWILHCFGPLTPLLQWYFFLFIGLGCLLARTFYDIVVFDYIKYKFLTTGQFIDETGFIPGLNDEERSELQVTPWLRMFALGAPIAGVLAGLVVILHVWSLVKMGHRVRVAKGVSLAWTPSSEEHMVFFVLAMPLVFILMAVRAEIRCLAVMTGSAWLPYSREESPSKGWNEVKTLELGTYTTDLEVANFFQFCTIFAFGRLCVSYLRDAPPQYRATLKLAGLQGVYLYVIFGWLRSLINLGLAVLGELKEDKDSWIMTNLLSGRSPEYASTLIRDKVMVQINPVFTVATLLCVYNMVILGRMDDVKKVLRNPNLKFQGVRALVLVTQIQSQVLMGLTVGSKLYLAVEKFPPQYDVKDVVHGWHLSTYRAQLMHASLLCYECLLVVLFNRWAWGSNFNAQADARELPSDLAEAKSTPSLSKPLLDAEDEA